MPALDLSVPSLLNRFFEAAATSHRPSLRRRLAARKAGDPAMAQTEQMLGHDGRRLLLVGLHRVGHRRIVVDHRHRHPPFHEFWKVMVIGQAEGRPHDQAVHPAIEQPIDLLGALRIALFEVRHPIQIAGPHGNRQIVGRRERVVDPRQHADPERIERWDHDADGLGATRLHSVDQQISPPTQLARCLDHPPAGLLAESLPVAAKNPRGGRQRHIGRFCYVFESRYRRVGHTNMKSRRRKMERPTPRDHRQAIDNAGALG